MSKREICGMNKTKLERFILKYSLGGTVDSVKWVFKDDKLYTSFMTPDKALLGKVLVKNVQFQDTVLGVYSTNLLSRLLSVVDGNLDMKLLTIDEKPIALKITSGYSEVSYALADLSVFPTPPDLKSLPEFETEIDVDGNFINTFIRGKSALSDVDTFTVIYNGSTKIVIGHSKTNSHTVTIPVKSNETFLSENQTFNANFFKEILAANRECQSAKLRISDKGLAHIVFDSGDYFSEYYLTALQDTD